MPSPSSPSSERDAPLAARPGQLARFRRVRRLSEQICRPLAVEDYVIQTMTDVSPPKWNLAHTTWFFETFLLKPALAGYREFHPLFGYLFNSYYEAVGERHPRPERGMLSRPTVEQAYEYRRHVDEGIEKLIETAEESVWSGLADVFELGLQHEQQHQELMLTDLKHILSRNPLKPVYREREAEERKSLPALEWIEFPGGETEIGFRGEGFCFDNEQPRHRVYLEPFRIASRLVTNGEYLEFIEDGGYRNPRYWLMEGWQLARAQGWEAPLYWEKGETGWKAFTLAGVEPIDEDEPVAHVSYFEADAYAAWAGKALPSESEWESAARAESLEGTFLESERFHPAPASQGEGSRQIFGDLWEWTLSAYAPYPGFRAVEGAIGEYNGKFMCNQYVLRGGSCATPQGHVRASYRNFFPAYSRWQFSGVRLVEH